MRTLFFLFAIGLSFASAIPASAQSLPTQKYLPVALAEEAGKAALASCAQKNYSVSVAVVDRYGTARFEYIADSVSTRGAADVARRKAYTTLNGASSKAYTQGQLGREGGPGTAIQYPDVVLEGGGLPIKLGNVVIAGIGVDGSPSDDADETCAAAGIAKIQDRLNDTLPSQKTLPRALAQEAANAAIATCQALNIKLAAVVVNRAGEILSYEDEGRPTDADVARRKAYTAVARHESTTPFADAIQKRPGGRSAPLGDPGLIAAAGGLPFIVDGDVVGGIGTSGGGQDEKCSQAGLDKIKDRLK